MLYLLGVLVFAAGLLASIALHEVGHMVPAKKFGVKVTQYMVGFGPTVWSKKRGETEYGLKAIPLGGYIRMIGMIPPRVDGKVSRWPRRLADLAESFRNASRADVEPADDKREFYRLAPWKKIIVMVGGPSMNLLIYLVITIVLLGTLGTKEATDKVNAVVQCVAPAGVTTPDVKADEPCPTGTQIAPANGVLLSGDRILAIDGVKTSSWADTVKIIERSAGQRLDLTVERAGVQQHLALTPITNTKYVSATGTATKQAGFIGVEMTEAYVAVPLTRIPGQLGDQIGQGFAALASFPTKIGNLFGTVFEGKARDPNGAVGIVGLGRIGGEVASSSNIDVLDKIYFLLSLLAGVNLLLFLFNLVPLLPLDGGHVAGAIVESVKRQVAKRRRVTVRSGHGGPAPPKSIYVDTAQMVPVLYGVAALLFAFTLLVVYADIVKPITLGG
ncbi:MAG: metalloprotease [Pseudonocardiales bacterium]|nr:metalloprotease [Pseudonocardiales bacterium]